MERHVRVIFRFPFKRPADFQAPEIRPAEAPSIEEQVWRCLLSLPGPDQPQDILAELEHDQVTFDWELLATTLHVPLTEVFEAASSLFQQHMGRPLTLDSESIQFSAVPPPLPRASPDTGSRWTGDAEASVAKEGYHRDSHVMSEGSARSSSSSRSLDNPASSRDFERTGMKSVESLGDGLAASAEPRSPAVELSIATPRDGGSQHEQQQNESPALPPQRSIEPRLTRRLRSSGQQRAHADSDDVMRQSLLADAIGSQLLPAARRPVPPPPETANARRASSGSSSFSDLSNTSLTESAMQDALISEAMGSSTNMPSLLASRMFPWSRRS
ncbi:hypothetical protein H4R23_002109 [Coemansia sp. Cherry 401B]|nr:hypothetical protein H4R23_002109 [Coemansia sp. Cherry 401B]